MSLNKKEKEELKSLLAVIGLKYLIRLKELMEKEDEVIKKRNKLERVMM